MNTECERTDPYDRALIDLLTTVPSVWESINDKKQTKAEQDALDRLVDAGLIEGWLDFEMTMDGFPERFRARVRICGFVPKLAAIAKLAEFFPLGWLSEDRKFQGRSFDEFSEYQEIRLTTDGERAKHDWLNGSPEAHGMVFTFLKGSVTAPPKIAVRIESKAAAGSTVAQATAVASTGDVTVNNQINVPPANVVVHVGSPPPAPSEASLSGESVPEADETPLSEDADPCVKAVADSPKKTRGQPSKPEHDERIAKEYYEGLEAGTWKSQAEYVQQKHPKKTASWLSKLLKRVDA